jgi:hypothetical protein
MLSAHPVYEGKSITVFPGIVRMSQIYVTPINAYLFAQDFPVEKFQALQSKGQIAALFSGDQEVDAVELPKFLKAATGAIDQVSLAMEHITYEALYADAELKISDDFFSESRGL